MTPRVIRPKRDESRYKEALLNSASELQADIISKRKIPEDVSIGDFLTPSLENMPIGLLKGVDKASSRIAKSLTRGENIAICCDYELDDTTAASVLDYALVNFFNVTPSKSKIYFVPKRANGYSQKFSSKLFNLEPSPTLVIAIGCTASQTANMSTYEKSMKKRGFVGDVIAIDNTSCDDEESKVFCFINPNQDDCEYPVKTVNLTMLMLLLIVRLRRKLVNSQMLHNPPKLGAITPFGACAAFSEIGDLREPYNRGFVKSGLAYINSNQSTPWNVYKESYGNENLNVDSQNIRQNLVSAVTSASHNEESGYRLVKFLQAETKDEAQRHLNSLMEKNGARLKDERDIFIKADYIAASQSESSDSINVQLDTFSVENQRMIIDKLLSKYGKPVCLYTPSEYSETEIDFESITSLNCNVFATMEENVRIEVPNNKMLWGRKIGSDLHPTFTVLDLQTMEETPVSIKEAAKLSRKNIFTGIKKGVYEHFVEGGKVVFDLQSYKKPRLFFKQVVKLDGLVKLPRVFRGLGVYSKLKECIPSGSMGSDESMSFTIEPSKINQIADILDGAASEFKSKHNVELSPFIISDGAFPDDRLLDPATISEVGRLEPFGMGFTYPQFEFFCTVEGQKTTGGILELRLNYRNAVYEGRWSNFEGSKYFGKLKKGNSYHFVAKPVLNSKFGRQSVLLDIVDVIG